MNVIQPVSTNEANRSGRWNSGMAAAALVALLLLITGATAAVAPSAEAANPTYHTTTDVSRRLTATAAPGSGYGIPAGAAFSTICQIDVPSQPVGAYHNTLYLLTNYNGLMFVPDAYSDSPHLAGQPPIAGIPICQSTTASTATPGGGTPSPSASQVAINWAVSHNGENFDSGYCLLFVAQAYAAAGINVGSASTAANYWYANPRGYARHTDRSPSYGALVFWGATSSNYAGHVGIYLGNDTVISTSSWPEPYSGVAVHEWSFSGRNNAGYPYLGWMHP